MTAAEIEHPTSNPVRVVAYPHLTSWRCVVTTRITLALAAAITGALAIAGTAAIAGAGKQLRGVLHGYERFRAGCQRCHQRVPVLQPGQRPRRDGACPPPPATIKGTITAADVIGPAAQGIAPGELGELMQAIRAGVTCANVHSTKFPNGEIRSQLRPGWGGRGVR